MNTALAEQLENGRPPVRKARRPVVLRPGERARRSESSDDHLFRNVEGESFWYRVIGDGEACLTGYSSGLTTVVVPEGIGGFRIVSLDSGAFADLPQLESVTCPRGLRRIEEHAFSRCAQLRKIRLNEGLESIGCAAFYLCNKLSSVRVPASVRHIGNSPFGAGLRGPGACPATLELASESPYLRFDVAGALYERCGADGWRLVDGGSVRVAEYEPLLGTVELGASAFLGNLSMRRFHGNAGLAHIGRDAFRACANLMEVELPDSLESIGAGAFSCAGVRRLRIPARCVSLESDALCTGPVFRGSAGRPYASTIEKLEADEENPALCSDGGALFARGADERPRKLLLCPRDTDVLDLLGIHRVAAAAFAGAEHIGELTVGEDLAGHKRGSVHFSCDKLHLLFSHARDSASQVELELPGGKTGAALVDVLFDGKTSNAGDAGLAVDAFLAAYDSALAALMAGNERGKIEAARLIACRCANRAGLDAEHERSFRGFLSANIASTCAHFGTCGYWEGFDHLAAAGLLDVGNARKVTDVLARCCGSLAVAHVLQLLEHAARGTAGSGQAPVTLEERIGDAYAL